MGEYQAVPTSMQAARPLDIFDITTEVRRGFSGYFAMIVIGGAIGLLLGLVLPKTYRAEVTLRPIATNTSAGGLASMLGRFGSLSGLSLLQSGGDSVTAVATLQSRELTRAFVHQNQLMPTLFDSKWNADGKKWRDSEKAPSDWDVYRLFEKSIRDVVEDRRTGLVRLAIEWRDREQAAAWANGLVALADSQLRAKAVEESTERIRLLREQLEGERSIEIRQGIYQMIETEIQSIVVSRSSKDFAFSVIDPAVVPDENAQRKPRPVLYLLTGMILGGCVAALLVLLRVFGVGSARNRIDALPR